MDCKVNRIGYAYRSQGVVWHEREKQADVMSETVETVNPQRPAVDSVERALAQVGDRWTFLILREAFFGVRRFDDIRVNTGASPAVLADRLKKLVDNGLFSKTTYSAYANRFDYRLTPKGLDLYPMIVMLMQWGDRWLDHDSNVEVQLVHDCGRHGPFPLTCPDCGEPVDARHTGWTTRNGS